MAKRVPASTVCRSPSAGPDVAHASRRGVTAAVPVRQFRGDCGSEPYAAHSGEYAAYGCVHSADQAPLLAARTFASICLPVSPSTFFQ